MVLVFLFILGAIIGSFIGALTWRWPKNISVRQGRSICPHCHKEIKWYDNIPIFSFLMLGGKCRQCHKKISKRYPIIELATAIVFAASCLLMPKLVTSFPWLQEIEYWPRLAVILGLAAIFLAIFIIDLEHQYIPDSLVFIILLIVITVMLLGNFALLFNYLAAGLGSAVFLLSLHLLTSGRGMGLGDVKLALAIGTLFGFPLSIVWMFGAFILGSIVGIVLLVAKVAKLKQKIAFGPFLISSLVITALFGFAIIDNLLRRQ